CVHVQGCVALISSGTGGFDNQFLGTTPSGRDVFFATHERLVSGDRDSAGDVYDARIGGGFPPAVPGPVECEGDACQSPVAAPIDTTPGSLSFSGSGNIVPLVSKALKPKKKCVKGKLSKRGKCVKRKRVRRVRHRRRVVRG